MPTTKTITVYAWNELSEKAKDNARYKYFSNDYFWKDEYLDTLKKALDFFNASYDSVSWENISHDLTFHHDSEVLELKGARLFAYINNNYANIPNKDRSFLLDQNCYFTGYCGDEDFLDPLRAFMSRPSSDITYKDLIESCVESLLKAMRADYEYQISDEGLSETCEANEYQFDAQGRIV